MLRKRQDWNSARSVIGDSNFLDSLVNFEKDNAGHLISVLQDYVDDPSFTYDTLKKISLSIATLANWIVGMFNYIKVFEELK